MPQAFAVIAVPCGAAEEGLGHPTTRSFANSAALSISSSGGLSRDEQSLQQGRLHHPLARAVFHKALTAKAEEKLWSAPAWWCGSEDLQCWAWREGKGSPAVGLSYRHTSGSQRVLKGRDE